MVAAAMQATKLLFLSDIPGVLVNDALQRKLSVSKAQELLAGGGASGGMLPKLNAALEALAAGVPQVHIIDGRFADRYLRPGQIEIEGPDSSGSAGIDAAEKRGYERALSEFEQPVELGEDIYRRVTDE